MIHPMQPTVQELPRERTDQAAELLADAFLDYPAFLAIGPRRAGSRRRMIRSYFRSRMAVARRFGGRVLAAEDDARLIGVAIVFDPGRHEQPVWALAYQARFLLFGPGTVGRGLRAQAALSAAQLDKPHVWLDSIAVDPSRQRSGGGRTLVGAVIERSEQLGAPAFLHTAQPANRAYYRQFGFEEVGEGKLPRGRRFWSMLRGAASTAPNA
jgi:GNAT superfamily N-acetyltransferase